MSLVCQLSEGFKKLKTHLDRRLDKIEMKLDLLTEPEPDVPYTPKEKWKKDITEQFKKIEDIGELSDGSHTFNSLYHQRAVLFAALVDAYSELAWKSKKHEDGSYCFDSGGKWFIVGIATPNGPYTYHYEIKYWDMFNCEELDKAPHWDGHTDADVERLLTLGLVINSK